MTTKARIEGLFKERLGWHAHDGDGETAYWNYGKCSARCKRGETWPEHLWAYAQENDHGVWKALVALGDDAAEMLYGDAWALLPMFEAEATRRTTPKGSSNAKDAG